MKAFGRPVTGLLLVAVLSSVNGAVTEHPAVVFFDDAKCTKPVYVLFPTTRDSDPACTASEICSASEGYSSRVDCTTDNFAYASSTLGTTPYLVVQSCTTETSGEVYSADGACHGGHGDTSFTVTLNSDGSGVLVTYKGFQCNEAESKITIQADKLAAHDCIDGVKYYTFNAATNTSTGAGTSAAAPLHLASSLLAAFLGGLAVVLL